MPTAPSTVRATDDPIELLQAIVPQLDQALAAIWNSSLPLADLSLSAAHRLRAGGDSRDRQVILLLERFGCRVEDDLIRLEHAFGQLQDLAGRGIGGTA